MLFVRLVDINDLIICCSYCFTIYNSSNNNDNDDDDKLLKCSFSLFNFVSNYCEVEIKLKTSSTRCCWYSDCLFRVNFTFMKVVAGLDEDLDPRQPRDLSTPASYTSQVLNLLQVHCVTYTTRPASNLKILKLGETASVRMYERSSRHNRMRSVICYVLD